MHQLLPCAGAALLVCLVAGCSGSGGTTKAQSSTAGTGGTSSHATAGTGGDSTGGAPGTGGMGGAPGTGGSTGGSAATGGAGAGGGGAGGAGAGGGDGSCSVDGNPGECMDTSVCASMSGYTSTPGYCPGAANVECCTLTPNVADNPPVPAGWMLMDQSQVTPAMTTWAVMILDDPKDYPIFSTAIMDFGTLMVMARVEWHPPDFQNNVVHRGVTLYEPG